MINGDKGTVNRIAVLDDEIPTASGVKVGTPFSDLYKQAFGNCTSAPSDEGVACGMSGGRQPAHQLCLHRYLERSGGINASDDTLKSWKVSKISLASVICA